MEESIQQQAFLFMPDISGFTKFVGETEIEHSTHIIRELLEIIINENRLEMELMEIEGDAVFFYRLNAIPKVNEIINQARHTFEKFHQHLLKYESRRICQCGACRTVNNLTLKFIIHAGYVSSYSINKHFKLIGKDVILLHRLLKNSVTENEYLLFTEPFFERLDGFFSKSLALFFEEKRDEFDGDTVRYKYSSIKHWLNEISAPDEDSLNGDNPDLVPLVTVRDEIMATANIIFSYMADLSKRIDWMAGVKEIQITTGSALNQAGTVHKCILDNNDVSMFKSNYFEHRENYLSFIETGSKGNSFGHQFTVEKKSDDCSIVQIQFLVKNNFIRKTLFNLFMRKKIEKGLQASVANLKTKF